KGPKLLSTGQWRQVVLFLFFAAVEVEGGGTEGGMGLHGDADGGVTTRDFFNGETVGEEVGTCAAVVFGKGQAEQSQFAHVVNEVIGELASAIHFFGTG